MSAKRLRSVVQSTAHHAVCSRNYVPPGFGKTGGSSELFAISIDLLQEGFHPELADVSGEFGELSSGGLREKFMEILASEGIDPKLLRRAKADLKFQGCPFPESCFVEAVMVSGETVSATVKGSFY